MATGKKRTPTADELAGNWLLTDFILDPTGDEGCPTPEERKRAAVTLRWWRGDFYEYGGGKYSRVMEEEMKRRAVRWLRQMNLGSTDAEVPLTTYFVNNLVFLLSSLEEVHIPQARALNSYRSGAEKYGIVTFSFKNGLFTLDPQTGTGKLKRHSPDYFTLVQFPYNYEPEAAGIIGGDNDAAQNAAQYDAESCRTSSQQPHEAAFCGVQQGLAEQCEVLVGDIGFEPMTR